MLASGKLVGFVFTNDYNQARAFYVGKLGCEFVSQDQFALVVTLGGHTIRISKIPNFTPVQGTVLGWALGEIEAVVEWLTSRAKGLFRHPRRLSAQTIRMLLVIGMQSARYDQVRPLSADTCGVAGLC